MHIHAMHAKNYSKYFEYTTRLYNFTKKLSAIEYFHKQFKPSNIFCHTIYFSEIFYFIFGFQIRKFKKEKKKGITSTYYC